jgi:hypothetical protein
MSDIQDSRDLPRSNHLPVQSSMVDTDLSVGSDPMYRSNNLITFDLWSQCIMIKMARSRDMYWPPLSNGFYHTNSHHSCIYGWFIEEARQKYEGTSTYASSSYANSELEPRGNEQHHRKREVPRPFDALSYI